MTTNILTQNLSNLRLDFESRYRMDSIIGSGGAGTVYSAYDLLLKRFVAIKKLQTHNVDGKTHPTEDLFREAETISKLQHPNIVSLHDIGEQKSSIFIVMELLKGEDFEALIQDGYLMQEQFQELAIQTLEGLVAAHAVNILHLDIKPANIILIWLPSGNLHVKLVDFGLARVNAKIQSPKDSTRNLKIVGSIHFMSPEQMKNEALDQRSDLYSLGCVFYYALSGKYPFPGESTLQVMAAHLRKSPVHLAEIRPDLPVDICNWVMSLFCHDINERPKSSLEALDQFTQVIR